MQSKYKIKETALLVIDVTNNFCHEKCEIKKWDISFNKIRKMVPRLKVFIEKYKNAGGQTILVKCAPWEKMF